jgi:hypothetical protein
MVGEVCSNVVDAGGSPGTSRISWGGGNLLLLLRRLHGAPACNWRATVANVERDVVEESQRGEGKLMV